MAYLFRPRIFNADNKLRESSLSTTDARHWASYTLGSTRRLAQHKNGEGAASLQDMAWRSVMIHMSWLDAETLEMVPWSIGERLWRQLQQNDLVSIATWQTFVRAYHNEIASSRPRDLMLHSDSPRMMSHDSQGRSNSDIVFSSHLSQITAPAFEWINLMTLVNVSLPRQEWIQLATLSNLGALYVQHSSDVGCPDDVVVRRWSRAARECGAFSVLKIVMLCNQPKLTLGTLEDLEHLPALRILHITGPTLKSLGMQELVQDSSWLWMDRSRLCLKLYAAWYSRQSKMKDLYNMILRTDLASDFSKDKPLLSVASGVDPYIRSQDQLWFELVSKKDDGEVSEKNLTSKSEQRSTEPRSKKPKIRQSVQQSMSDLIGFIL